MKWTIDPQHSAIEFGVKHLGIATVRGRFTTFSGQLETASGGAPQALAVEIDAASIDTNAADRDTHLRSADFLDAARHPTLTFRSTAIRPAGEQRYDVEGDLTLRDVTKPVQFTVTTEPTVVDPWGGRRIAGRATGALSRKAWGLTWNSVLEAGGLLVGDEVRFTLDVQLVAEQKAAAAA